MPTPSCIWRRKAMSTARSTSPAEFINTNVVGTYVLLEAALAHWRSAASARAISASTISPPTRSSARWPTTARSPRDALRSALALFRHQGRLRPSRPGLAHTYGLPVVLTNCSNNYGPHQFVEKLIPLTILKCLAGKPMPVYGRGANIRDWLFVEDHAEALAACWKGPRSARPTTSAARPSGATSTWCMPSAMQWTALPRVERPAYRGLVTFVPDRPGHDFRYAIDATKMKTELGWAPKNSFESGLALTVQWYLDNRAWWEPLLQADDANAPPRPG